VPRKIFEEDEVGDEAGASVRSFEQVMAQEGIFRGPSGQTRLEGAHVVDPLSREDPDVEEVLIDVKGGVTIEVESLHSTEDAREKCTSVGIGEDLDSRLKNRVPSEDLTILPDLGSIERVSESTHEPGCRPTWEPSIGIECEDEGHPLEPLCLPLDNPEPRIAPEKKLIQLSELPTLPLPPHPSPLRGIPPTGAMQEEKTTFPPISVACIEFANPFRGCGKKGVIRIRALFLRIGEVREKCKGESRIRISLRVGLEGVENVLNVLARTQENWNGHHCAELLGNPVTHVESREWPGPGKVHRNPVCQSYANPYGG
jgi:hypothetical protein